MIHCLMRGARHHAVVHGEGAEERDVPGESSERADLVPLRPDGLSEHDSVEVHEVGERPRKREAAKPRVQQGGLSWHL